MTVSAFFKAFANPTFRILAAAIVLTEIVTIGIAALLLNRGIANQIDASARHLSAISAEAASSSDWAGLPFVVERRKVAPQVLKRLQNHLHYVNRHFFSRNNGGIGFAVIRKNQEFSFDDTFPRLYSSGLADRWEIQAFETGRATVTPTPYSGDFGTYMAAYTPVRHRGRVIALLVAWRESPTIAELQTVVRHTFFFAILPAAVIAIAAALILSGRLAEPMEVLREIASPEPPLLNQHAQREGDRPLERLSPKEREVAELVAKGLKNVEIAVALHISSETVKHHLKSIKVKTGLNRFDLAKCVWQEHQRTISPLG